jgi:hypothetical protein
VVRVPERPPVVPVEDDRNLGAAAARQLRLRREFGFGPSLGVVIAAVVHPVSSSLVTLREAMFRGASPACDDP